MTTEKTLVGAEAPDPMVNRDLIDTTSPIKDFIRNGIEKVKKNYYEKRPIDDWARHLEQQNEYRREKK
jgi:hypothetical protein